MCLLLCGKALCLDSAEFPFPNGFYIQMCPFSLTFPVSPKCHYLPGVVLGKAWKYLGRHSDVFPPPFLHPDFIFVLARHKEESCISPRDAELWHKPRSVLFFFKINMSKSEIAKGNIDMVSLPCNRLLPTFEG